METSMHIQDINIFLPRFFFFSFFGLLVCTWTLFGHIILPSIVFLRVRECVLFFAIVVGRFTDDNLEGFMTIFKSTSTINLVSTLASSLSCSFL